MTQQAPVTGFQHPVSRVIFDAPFALKAREFPRLVSGMHSLALLHVQKRTQRPGWTLPTFGGVFELDTCQRRIWIGSKGQLALFKQTLSGSDQDAQVDFLVGPEAYAFLLRVAAGLESEIVGETDVFGQVKQSWTEFFREFGTSNNLLVKQIDPWMQKLFEDTKAIRTDYLRGIGAGSYGSLTRKMLRPRKKDRVLLIGAGQLGESIAPYLTDAEVFIWNRTESKARKLGEKLRESARSPRRIAIVQDLNDPELWASVQFAVICVPANEVNESQWKNLWQNHSETGKAVLHLGCLRSEAEHWLDQDNFLCLTDLFERKKAQSEVRDLRLERADRACQEKAILRSATSFLPMPRNRKLDCS